MFNYNAGICINAATFCVTSACYDMMIHVK
jgi:hypothetical protein